MNKIKVKIYSIESQNNEFYFYVVIVDKNWVTGFRELKQQQAQLKGTTKHYVDVWYIIQFITTT